MSDGYQVLSISHHGEQVVETFAEIAPAFEECLARWATRKNGSPVYAVRDCSTEQRWSYADIKELRAHV